MSNWVPKIITSDPISCLIASQALDEEDFISPKPSTAKPVTTSPTKTTPTSLSSRLPFTSTSLQRTIPSSSSSNLTNLSTAKSIKLTSSTSILSSSASLNTPPQQPITDLNPNVIVNNKTSLPIDSQVLANTSNVLSTSPNPKDADIQSEDNSTKLLLELQPNGSHLILKKTGDSVSEVIVDQSQAGVTSAIKEIKSMEISDNKTFKKLWKLPDSGKISNPYFGGKREVDLNNASTSNEKKTTRKTNEDGSKLNAKENNSRAKNIRPKNDVIPFIELDETDSINTPSTTDESDDSLLNNEQSKGKSSKKRQSTRKETKKETIKSGKDSTDVSSAINKKKEDKVLTIPGLGSPTLTTTIEEIKETTNETINHNMHIVQSVGDNLVQPMETDEKSTENKVKMTPTISNEATMQSTVINGTSSETQQQEDKQKCIRIGCCNYAVENAEWDFEYCSSNCAVEHCKTAFLNWVTTRKLENQNSPTTKAPTQAVTTTID